jgi:hypothetical protein
MSGRTRRRGGRCAPCGRRIPHGACQMWRPASIAGAPGATPKPGVPQSPVPLPRLPPCTRPTRASAAARSAADAVPPDQSAVAPAPAQASRLLLLDFHHKIERESHHGACQQTRSTFVVSAPERLRIGPPRLSVLLASQCLRVHPRNHGPRPYGSATRGHGPGRCPFPDAVRACGITNKSLRALTARLLGTRYNASQMAHELRRLRLNGLIRRIEHTRAYVLTPITSLSPCSTQSSQPPAQAASHLRAVASPARTTPGADRDRSQRRGLHRPGTTQACGLKT